jgi:hypothetical protein
MHLSELPRFACVHPSACIQALNYRENQGAKLTPRFLEIAVDMGLLKPEHAPFILDLQHSETDDGNGRLAVGDIARNEELLTVEQCERCGFRKIWPVFSGNSGRFS